MINDKTVKKYTTSSGIDVFKLPVEAFPNHVTNCYLVMDEKKTLIDTGSGWDSANRDLVDGFDTVNSEFGNTIRPEDLERIIITHGHIDHFGGVNFVADQSGAEVAIHELDASVIRHFKERLLASSKGVHHFLNQSGLAQDSIEALRMMNKWSKDQFRARHVDLAFGEGPIPDSNFVAYHAPGHCPGQVCLQLDDILFTADHVLSRVTPNQSPESITRYTGVGHYMESLAKVRKLEGVRIGLGGHELEMENWQDRIDDTIAFHEGRLEKTYDLLVEPKTMADVSEGLFGKQMDYHILLAMLETGSHLEYLYDRGRVVIANIDEVEDDPTLVPLYERAT